jgi:hypothetical protein
VLGLFTYLDDNNEIDIEFSRWGWETGTNAGYTCQPWQTAGNTHPFDMTLTGDYSTHRFNWQASEINYRSLYGHYYEPPDPSYEIQSWDYTGPDIPPESTERVHMNLWLMGGIPPSDGQELEIVVSDFNFTDLSITPTLNPKPSFITPTTGAVFEAGDPINFDWSDVIPNTGDIHYRLQWTQNPYDTDSRGHYNTGGSWSGEATNHTLNLNTPGKWYYHVNAFDDGGEFGEMSDGPGPWDEDFLVIADIPSPPMDLNAVLHPPGVLSDVKLTWDASSDDGAQDADVVEYVIYRSTDITGAYTEIGTVTADGSSSYSYTDSGAGDGDPSHYFYRIHSRDNQGREIQNQDRCAKWVTPLDEGWNHFSIPLVQDSTQRTDVLATIEGNYEALQSHVPGKVDNWLHWNSHKLSVLNDNIDISYGKGYYIKMSSSDSLVTAGIVSYILSFDLKEGWNFIGVPAASIPLSRVKLPDSVDIIDHYDMSAGPTNLERYDPESRSGDLIQLTPGEAYWIHSRYESRLRHMEKIYEEPESQNWEEVYLWWDTIVDIAVYDWGIDDPYFAACLVKQESWFRPDCFNQAEKDAYEAGENPWHGEYYGKGLLQITGPWIAGTPYPDPTDWIYNMPATAIRDEAPEMTDAYNATQNLNRGFWYLKCLLDYYGDDQYKAATAYRYGWQSLDNGEIDPYDNYYVDDVFGYKSEYLADLGLQGGAFSSIPLYPQLDITPGINHSFQYKGQDILYYIPHNHTQNPKDTRIYFIIHGAGRQYEDNFDVWMMKKVSEKYNVVLVSPHFDKVNFPGYHHLNLEGERADLRLIELFNKFTDWLNLSHDTFYMFGFSGGGQFTHRFVMEHPEYIEKAVAGGSGVYTFPNTSVPFSHGLDLTGYEPMDVTFDLEAAYKADMSIMVGLDDTERSDDLSKSEQSDAQGLNRLERARNFFNATTENANKNGWELNYSYQEVPDCDHTYGPMKSYIIDYLFL